MEGVVCRMERASYLVLENGKVFKGKGFGAERDVIAEVVFTTGMTGYLETLTDRSYCGQIVVQTFPLIGNYGVIPEDFESENFFPKAYIVRQWCEVPSNFRSQGDLNTFFNAQGIVGLCGIDTRALTRTIRENGVMNGQITSDPDSVDLEKIKSYRSVRGVEQVSSPSVVRRSVENPKRRVAFMDFGYKKNIIRELEKRNCEVIVCPHNTGAEEIMALQPDGIMLSNGPGNPTENVEAIEALKTLLKKDIPIFGICLGHQLLALANGFKTEKLKYGHRGASQPVKDLSSGRIYISSQNHGYAVINDSVDPDRATISFVNVNDNTNEGITYKNVNAFSVQFHPEARGGPRDTAWLFDNFMDMMEEGKKNAAQ